jgi:hypothetical protein
VADSDRREADGELDGDRDGRADGVVSSDSDGDAEAVGDGSAPLLDAEGVLLTSPGAALTPP